MTDNHNKPALSTLPREVFDNIVSRLAGRDLKRLRLAHPGHDDFILKYLFRRVCLSMFKKDRELFLAVAGCPHLAEHVKILEWVVFPDTEAMMGRWEADNESGVINLTEKTEYLVGGSWLPLDNSRSGAIAVWDASRSIFDSALDKMPHLDTLVLQPFTKSSQRYRSWFFGFDINDYDELKLPILDEPDGPYHMAREFLRQANQCRNVRASEASDTAASVSFSTGDPSSSHADITFYGPIHGSPFIHLTEVDLSLGHVDMKWIRSALDQLLSARALKELHVVSNFQDALGPLRRESAQAEIGAMFLGYLQVLGQGWGNLKGFSMTSLRVPVHSLAHFITFHAAILRKLSFMHCALTAAHVQALVCIPLPRLAAIEAFSTGPGVTADPKDFLDAFHYGTSVPRSYILTILAHPPDTIINIRDGTQTFDDQRAETITPWAIPKGQRYLVEVKQYFTSFRFSKEHYKVRWKWGRAYPGADVSYWRADDEDDGEPTVMWDLYTRSSRRYASDAYKEFDAWSPGVGNVAIPTPFGLDFKRFVDDQPASLGHAAFSKGIPASARIFNSVGSDREELICCGVWPPRSFEKSFAPSAR